MSDDDYRDSSDDECSPEAEAVRAVRRMPALRKLLDVELGAPLDAVAAAKLTGPYFAAVQTGLADEHIAVLAGARTRADRDAFAAMLPGVRRQLHGILLALAGDPTAMRAQPEAAKAYDGLRPDGIGLRRSRLVGLIERGAFEAAIAEGPGSYEETEAVRELREIEPALNRLSAEEILAAYMRAAEAENKAPRTAAKMSIDLDIFGERRSRLGKDGTGDLSDAITALANGLAGARRRYPTG